MTKTLTVNAAGTDTIDGAVSAVVNEAYGYIEIESNQASARGRLPARPVLCLLGQDLAASGAWSQYPDASARNQTVTLSGASTNASIPIPANCIVLAVGARVLTAITGAHIV